MALLVIINKASAQAPTILYSSEMRAGQYNNGEWTYSSWKYHNYVIFYHSLYSCDAADKCQPLISFAALFHDLGKHITKYYMEVAKWLSVKFSL